VNAAYLADEEVFSLLYESIFFLAFLFFHHNNIPLYAWLKTKANKKNSAILIKKPSLCSFSTYPLNAASLTKRNRFPNRWNAIKKDSNNPVIAIKIFLPIEDVNI
jgi:hypothetical protein